MANAMLEAIVEFADSEPANVNLVRIAVFPQQPEIFEGFRSEIYVEAPGKKMSWWKAKKEAIGTIIFNQYVYDLKLFQITFIFFIIFR